MKLLYNSSFKNQIFLTFALIYLFVIVVGSGILIGIAIPSLQRSNIRYEEDLVRQSLRRVDDYLKNINSVCIQASYSTDSRSVLAKNYNGDMILEYVKDRESMFRYLQHFSRILKGIYGIFIYNQSGYSYYYCELNIVNTSFDIRTQDWYKDLISSANYGYIIISNIHLVSPTSSTKYIVSLIRSIRDTNDFSVIGVAEIQIDPQVFKSILNDTELNAVESGRDMTLVDSSGLVIYSVSGKYKVGQKYNPETFALISGAGDAYSSTKGSTIVNAKYSNYSKWYLIGEAEKTTVFKSSNNIMIAFFIFSGFSLILMTLLGFIMSRSLTRPVALLQEKVTELEHGNFQSKIQIEGNNELSQLSERFDQMSHKLDNYVKRIYEIENLKRQAEILALQTQINPHFIFNTLNAIKYLATLQNSTNIVEILDAFCTLMKAALKSPNELITFSEEFARLNAFIRIQTISSFGKIKICVDCDPEVLDCMTVGLILQPLVENAVFHGIKPKMNNHQILSGNIQVTAAVCENTIQIHIIDDGIGMSQSRIAEVLMDKKTGIGISNVNSRIKLCFGEEYGLSITSEAGNGCDVSILLPMIKKEEGSSYNISPMNQG